MVVASPFNTIMFTVFYFLKNFTLNLSKSFIIIFINNLTNYINQQPNPPIYQQVRQFYLSFPIQQFKFTTIKILPYLLTD